jgi:hypothetical protein
VLVASITVLLLLLLVASAEACLTLPAVSRWEGHWKNRFGNSGTWWAEVTANETSPGVWQTTGDGEVVVPAFGSRHGHLDATLTCTGPTTDSQTGHWTDDLGDNVTTVGTLSIGSNVSLESGTWSGSTIQSSSDEGTWEGEFHPTAQSGGTVPGAVEVDSSSGTLITSLQTEVATQLPLLPGNDDIAPVGGVSFAASLPVGATIRIKLILPAGSHPTNLFKLVNGSYVEMPATIAGETVEYEITDGGTFDEDNTANGEVIDPVVPVSSGVQVRTGELPEAARGSAYSVQLVASGGSSPYKWKKVGKLPKGLKLTKGGILQGTPSSKLAQGSYPLEVSVSDSGKPKQKGSAKFTLTIG